jgi:hypothetical protein
MCDFVDLRCKNPVAVSHMQRSSSIFSVCSALSCRLKFESFDLDSALLLGVRSC